MKSLVRGVAYLSLFFLVTACGHHRDVRPGANGLNNVSVKADDQDAGARDALAQAEHYCQQFDKHAVIMEENAKYTGDMDEKTYKGMKKASKVAKTISGSTYGTGANRRARPTYGADDESTDLGQMTGVGGSVLDDMAGQGYNVSMRFSCK